MTSLDIAIDVSDAQGRIDWAAVAASGIKIAMIKATEGATFTAHTFDANRRGALASGISVIPYHFLRPGDSKSQIAHFRSVSGLSVGMAFALDFEGRASQTCTVSVAEEIGEELAVVAKRKPLGYWGIPGSTPAAPTAKMRAWERWVPRYPVTGVNAFASLPMGPRSMPEHWWKIDASGSGLPRFGQYTAWGRVPGIAGLVDRSVIFADNEEAALDWCRGETKTA